MRSVVGLFFVLVLSSAWSFPSFAENEKMGIQRKEWRSGERRLVVEIWDDELAHFELAEIKGPKDPMTGIWMSPMIDEKAATRFGGPTKAGFRVADSFIETRAMRIDVENDSSCVRVTDRLRNAVLTRLCGENLSGPLQGPEDGRVLKIEKNGIENVYGIGNLFQGPKVGNVPSADGDWVGRHWEGRNHGNFRFGPHRPKNLNEPPRDDSFYGGGPSVSQFPVMFALGGEAQGGYQTYGLLLDSILRTSWYFNQTPWRCETWGDQLRFFVFTGKDLADVRKKHLALIGKPPVPPRSSFGLWISKFGYKKWEEIERDLRELREKGFLVDGVALDLQWFGGSFGEPSSGRMGTLAFGNDFPKPAERLAQFRRDYGVEFMPIEESYIDKRVDDFKFMEGHRYLAMLDKDGGRAVNLTRDIKSEGGGDFGVWWGTGGMVDWSHPEARRYWHEKKRLPLSKMGIFHHWLDLGEPEMYYEFAWYHGLPETSGGANGRQHGAIHNVYNLLWAKGIDEGYRDATIRAALKSQFGLDDAPRFFTMSRAGTLGSQRYGAMWSGDVGKNRANYVAHENTQMHMSMVGMDYYGSDAGGFLGGEEGVVPGANDDELFSQWFANNSLSSTPLRPHRWTLDEDLFTPKPFGPHNRGDAASNLANARQRYELAPYYYSLAHLANQFGEPIIPPLVYYFPGDRKVREMGNQKLIGSQLMFGVVLGYGQVARDIYFPAGDWVNYHSGEWLHSNGATGPEFPSYRERGAAAGLVTTPLFARAGAIIPVGVIESKTRNVSTLASELAVKVFASPTRTLFPVFEDDGVSVAYQSGRVRVTDVSQQQQDGAVVVNFAKAKGGFKNAPASRVYSVELFTKDREVSRVTVGGDALPYCQNRRDENCWYSGDDDRFLTAAEKSVRNLLNNGYLPERGRVVARSGSLSVNSPVEFRFELGEAKRKVTSAHFVCSNAGTLSGESIYVTGNTEKLGNWDPAKAVRLVPVRYETWRRWSAIVYDLPADTNIEWKCFKRKESGKDVIAWDSNPDNQKFRTPSSGFGGTHYAGF